MEHQEVSSTHSTLLVGEGTTPERLSIREFKYLEPQGPYMRNYQLLSSRLEEAFSERTFDTIKSVWRDESVNVEKENFNDFANVAPIEPVVIHKLKTHLIAPKIVTGDIARLEMSEVEESILPRAMVSAFQRINTSSRRDTMIEGYDNYYTVVGQLRLGGRSIASVACGMCISPYVKVVGVYAPDRLAFRAQVAPFTVKDRQDLSEWQSSIESSRNREAHERLHPLNGGLVNPR